jgi:hypothetical protein
MPLRGQAQDLPLRFRREYVKAGVNTKKPSSVDVLSDKSGVSKHTCFDTPLLS